MCQPGTGAEGAGPTRFAWALMAPQHGIERMPLAGPIGVAAALRGQRDHGLLAEVADGAEPRIALDAEVQVTVEVVDGAGLLQPLDHQPARAGWTPPR